MNERHSDDNELQSLYRRFNSLHSLLRASGFAAGPDRWVSVQDLLIKLDINNTPPKSAQELCHLISPLFCQSAEDQTSFYNIFEHWRRKRDQYSEENIVIPDEIPEDEFKVSTRRFYKKTKFWVLIALTFLVIISVLVETVPTMSVWFDRIITGQTELIAEENLPQETTTLTPQSWSSTSSDVWNESNPQWTSSAEAADAPVITRRPQVVPLRMPAEPIEITDYYRKQIHIFWLVLIVSPFVLVFFTWLRHRRLQSVLTQGDAVGSTRLIYLQFKGGKSLPFALGEFTQKMRRSLLATTRHLNLDKTIETTINSAGLFSPVMRERHIQPDYLVLVDRPHNADQLASLGDAFVNRLYQEHLHVHHYYFRGDPRWCYKREGGKLHSYSINKLITMHPAARLLVIGDGVGLYDQMTRKLYGWINMFSRWQHRIWLTNQPQPWGYEQSQLADAGFHVAPLNSAGIAAVASWLHATAETPQQKTGLWFINKYDPRAPKVLSETGAYLERPRSRSDRTRYRKLLQSLHGYLGVDGIELLTACAGYPKTHGNLTIALDQKLFPDATPFTREQRLIKVSQLSWMRDGKLPQALRYELLYKISHRSFEAIGKIYNELLSLGRASDDAFKVYLPDEQNQRSGGSDNGSDRRTGRNSEEQNDARQVSEDVLLTKLIKGRRSRLDSLLPEAIAKTFRPTNPYNEKPRLITTIVAVMCLVLIASWTFVTPVLENLQTQRMVQANSKVALMIGAHSQTQTFAENLQSVLANWGFKQSIVVDIERLPSGDSHYFRFSYAQSDVQYAEIIRRRLNYLSYRSDSSWKQLNSAPKDRQQRKAEAIRLLTLEGDSDSEIFALLLGNLGASARSEILNIVNMLAYTQSNDDLYRAMFAIPLLGEEVKPFIPRMLEILEREQDEDRQGLILLAIGLLGKHASNYTRDIASYLDSPSESIKEFATLSLALLGNSVSGSTLSGEFSKSIELVVNLQNGTAQQRQSALRVLGQDDELGLLIALGFKNLDIEEEQIAVLSRLLSSTDSDLAVSAAIALGSLGERAGQYKYDLLNYFLSDDSDAKEVGAIALGMLGVKDPQINAQLIERFLQSEGEEKLFIGIALQMLQVEDTRIVDNLLEGLNNDDIGLATFFLPVFLESSRDYEIQLAQLLNFDAFDITELAYYSFRMFPPEDVVRIYWLSHHMDDNGELPEGFEIPEKIIGVDLLNPITNYSIFTDTLKP